MSGEELTSSRPLDAGTAAAGSKEIAQAVVGRGRLRAVGSFLVTVAGMLTTAWAFSESTWAWTLWILVGAAAGSVAGRGRLVWTAWLGVVASYALAGFAGTASPSPFWLLWAAVAAALLSVGFAAGTCIGWRRDPAATARSTWRGMRPAWRRLSVGAIVVGLLAFSVRQVTDPARTGHSWPSWTASVNGHACLQGGVQVALGTLAGSMSAWDAACGSSHSTSRSRPSGCGTAG